MHESTGWLKVGGSSSARTRKRKRFRKRRHRDTRKFAAGAGLDRLAPSVSKLEVSQSIITQSINSTLPPFLIGYHVDVYPFLIESHIDTYLKCVGFYL